MNGSGTADTTVAGISKDQADTNVARPRGTAEPLANWRNSKWLALVEFLLVALIFYADHRKLIPISKTPELLLLGWISLRVRGLRWRDVGLTRYRSWRMTIGLGVVLGTVLETFQLLVTQPILGKLVGRQPDLDLFRALTGNIKMTGLFIALSWTLAAFGEELFWRGYLMNRVEDVFGRTKAASVLCLVAVSAIFGLAHGYQGPAGWIEEGLAGLALGLMYLRTGKKLSVPIIAHGVCDTIDMVLIYFGKMPGM
jgi:CAAX protease family protein